MTTPKKKNKPSAAFLKPKEIKVVTKAVLNKIANWIYNPKTGDYLNLCKETLQNGLDPACQTRTMHCGLGELYFVVTGRHPEEDRVDEADVVQEVIDRSTIDEHVQIHEKKMAQAKKQIKNLAKLDVPDDVIVACLEHIDDEDYEHEKSDKFEQILNDIPIENDSHNSGFKDRARRVANKLREAAKLLPR